MAKVLRVVAVVASAVALVTPGLQAVGAIGLKTSLAISAVASATAAVASFGAQLLAPKPVAKGSPAQITIAIEPPRPYAVGRVMVGGVIRYDRAYGATVDKVPNPYRWQVRVLSGVGPIQGFVGDYFDFAPINTTFYNTSFLRISRQLGARPEASRLNPGWAGAPGWTTSARLSGCAAVGLNMFFDKNGERYASGVPIYTALIDGEKVYDPRLDSTFPGGSGTCRAGVESTYVYSQNPACHAVTYALGRFQNGFRLFGLGQPVDTLDMAAVVDWANDCDANGWTVNMVLQEGGTGANLPEQRRRNLDDLCAAGGGRWYQAGGLLSFDWHRPRLSLATLTDDDILEAGGGTDAVQTVRDRMNGVRPQYVSPAHNWQQITAKEIVGSTYRTEDGAPLTQVWPLNGVTNAEQAGELAAYAMADSRELGPMDVQAKANWRFYRPGDTITVDSSLMAYQGQAVINQRSLNPETMAVSLSLKSETPGKHDFALGKVAEPPPTPVLAQTPEERDVLAAAAFRPLPGDLEYADGTPVEDLKPAEPGSDVTVENVRTIEAEFPVIEIKQGEAGHTGTRNVPHTAKRGGVALTGGTWSIVSTALTGATVTVNSSTGVASISGVTISGSYTIRYTHTDGVTTDQVVNVSYVASPILTTGTSIVRSFSSSTGFVAVSNEMTIQIPTGQSTAELVANAITLRVTGFPVGNTQCEFRWTRETSPGTWSIVGSAQLASPHPNVTDSGGLPIANNGSVTINRTATGLAAGSTQRFRLEARISGGNIKTVSIVAPNNTCTVAA